LYAMQDYDLSPELTIGHAQHRLLAVLALTGQGHSAKDADFLLWELDRAKLVPDDQLPQDVVRVGSRVRYRDPQGEHTAQLTYPDDRSASRQGVSVLSPLGTALLGLRRGQSMAWTESSGKRR